MWHGVAYSNAWQPQRTTAMATDRYRQYGVSPGPTPSSNWIPSMAYHDSACTAVSFNPATAHSTQNDWKSRQSIAQLAPSRRSSCTPKGVKKGAMKPRKQNRQPAKNDRTDCLASGGRNAKYYEDALSIWAELGTRRHVRPDCRRVKSSATRESGKKDAAPAACARLRHSQGEEIGSPHSSELPHMITEN